MRCPHCSYELADGMLPARCPECGHNLANICDTNSALANAKKLATQRRGFRSRQFADDGETMTAALVRKHPWDGKAKYIALLLCIAAVGLVVFVLWHMQVVGGVTLPDVVGWRIERAQPQLERAGFKVRTTSKLADEPEGLILEMDPKPQARIIPGTTITLVVSKPRIMPEVVGKTKDEATKLLEEQGLTWEFVEKPDDGTPDLVLDSSVKAGSPASSKKKIALTISKKREIPNLVSLSEADATKALEALEVKIKVSYVIPAAGQKEEIVVKTDPAYGTVVTKDSVVTMTVTKNLGKTIEAYAKEIVNAVYSGDPETGGYTGGSVLKQYADPTMTIGGKSIKDASEQEVYQAFVKQGIRLPEGVDARIGVLTRSVVHIESVAAGSDGAVSVRVVVKWDWSKLGGEYAQVTSTDTHEIKLQFNSSAQLTSFSDPAGDVPEYTMS